MAINCNVKFNQNTSGVYNAGQTVSGIVQVILSEAITVTGVCLKVAGFAEVKWDVTKKNESQSVCYSDREDFIALKIYFIGSEEGNSIEVPVGQHIFKFSYPLTEKLPPSFVGTHGFIRYSMSLNLEIADKINQTFMIPITILNPLDLNLNALILKIPTQMEMTKNICCGPCGVGPFSLLASVPQSGYVTGETIKIYAEVCNMSKMEISEMRFMLRRIVNYFSKSPKKETFQECIIIDEKQGNGVPMRTHEMYDIRLVVPQGPQSNTLCHILQITYDIKVEAIIKSFYSSPAIYIPITIGTAPLREIGPSNLNNPPAYSQTTLTEEKQLHSIGPFTIPEPESQNAANIDVLPPNLASVTFEESPFGHHRIDTDEEHHIGKQFYTPRYPVYKAN